MSIYQITFSPTGGTQKVADVFTKAYGYDSIQIDLLNTTVDFSSYRFKADDICIFTIPSYSGRVPKIAISRLKQMCGGNSKAILICTYGNRAYDDTLLELKDTLKKSSFYCIAAIAAVTEHSIMHQFGTGRPDENDCKELTSYAKEIQQKIKEGSTSNNIIVPGKYPYRDYTGVSLKPKAGKACIKCGNCAAKCPVSAIPVSNPSKTNKEVCISCMRCVSVCPHNARNVNRLVLTVAAKKMKKLCGTYKRNELSI